MDTRTMTESIGLLLSGPLGLAVAESAAMPSAIGLGIKIVATVGKTPALRADYEKLITERLRAQGIEVQDVGEIVRSNVTLVCVGWRSLVAVNDAERDVYVIHDSLLPRLRGWNPLVTAVEIGLEETGVTLFRASGVPDTGPIVRQESFSLGSGVPIAKAIDMAGQCAARLVADFFLTTPASEIVLAPQSEHEASLSPWRDDDDYIVDWARSSLDVQQFILSRGFPYQGARTSVNGAPITIGQGRLRADFPDLAISSPGKTVAIENGRPIVACGTGFIELVETTSDDGKPYRIDSLRTRFGS